MRNFVRSKAARADVSTSASRATAGQISVAAEQNKNQLFQYVDYIRDAGITNRLQWRQRDHSGSIEPRATLDPSMNFQQSSRRLNIFLAAPKLPNGCKKRNAH
jgi:hypothetical protein